MAHQPRHFEPQPDPVVTFATVQGLQIFAAELAKLAGFMRGRARFIPDPATLNASELIARSASIAATEAANAAHADYEAALLAFASSGLPPIVINLGRPNP